MAIVLKSNGVVGITTRSLDTEGLLQVHHRILDLELHNAQGNIVRIGLGEDECYVWESDLLEALRRVTDGKA